MKIEMENIGGLKGINQFTLHKGLNVVKAPNATGKTSFSRAFELLCLDDKNLCDSCHHFDVCRIWTHLNKYSSEMDCVVSVNECKFYYPDLKEEIAT